MARKTTTRKLVLTAIRSDGTEGFLFSRRITDGEDVNLYCEAKAELDSRVESDDLNERRIVRDDRPRTVSVRAELMVGGQLVDRDEAH